MKDVMLEFIEQAIKLLVDKPDEVNIEIVESEQRLVYELTVGEGDYGKVIGKSGRNISALRTLVFAINAKEGGKRARLDVVD
ncbi:MAG: KH domain-containing protein [Candidatus Marinimicrobia bacterium]|nr:KH domain-containing protein [Candidatus Neomarinimicrobiota bacterium]